MRIAAWLGAAAIAAFVWWSSAHPADDLPPSFPHADKLVHAAVYGLLAALCALGLGPARRGPVTAAIAIALAVGYGVVDEWHQSHVPGRDASIADLVADLVGATLGAALVVYRRRHGDRP